MIEVPLKSNELKELLHSELDQMLYEFGLTKFNDNYYWFSHILETGYRKVFHYQKLKGESGVFVWGYCFPYISTFGMSGSVRSHKTEKSIKLHLFDEPQKFREIAGTPHKHFNEKGMVSHWGIKQAMETIKFQKKDCYSEIADWFNNENSIEDCLAIIKSQREIGGRYKGHNPGLNYVESFLLAKSGKIEQSKKLMIELKNEYSNYNLKYEKTFDKIIDKLEKLEPSR